MRQQTAFPSDELTADVVNLDYEGRGVARVAGKTVFIEGALPNERVQFRVNKQHKGFDEATMIQVLCASPYRQQPLCIHHQECGGCSMQHIEYSAQTAMKQRVVEEQLMRLGKVQPDYFLPAIHGLAWRYRQRGRLSVRLSAGQLYLGFQGKHSHDVVDIQQCWVLPKAMERTLPILREHLFSLAATLKLRFVEFALGERVYALNFAVAHKPNRQQQQQLHHLLATLNADGNYWQLWLQIGRGEAEYWGGSQEELSYSLPEFDVRMPYAPSDFTQVNSQTNALMVGRAIRLLAPQQGERVADLFCGLGNFTLPLAKSGAKVLAIEGLPSLVERAKRNAQLNQCHHIDFRVANLFEANERMVQSWGRLDKMLLDPPRAGAHAVVQALHKPFLPKRIVYVSCHPASFARDAAVLVSKGYRFTASGVMNLFAQTTHSENIAVFDWQEN